MFEVFVLLRMKVVMLKAFFINKNKYLLKLGILSKAFMESLHYKVFSEIKQVIENLLFSFDCRKCCSNLQMKHQQYIVSVR